MQCAFTVRCTCLAVAQAAKFVEPTAVRIKMPTSTPMPSDLTSRSLGSRGAGVGEAVTSTVLVTAGGKGVGDRGGVAVIAGRGRVGWGVSTHPAEGCGGLGVAGADEQALFEVDVIRISGQTVQPANLSTFEHRKRGQYSTAFRRF